MPVTVRIHPIVPGRLDGWSQFVDELSGPRRVEWAQSHRRRDVTRVVISVVGPDDRPQAVVFMEASNPSEADRLLRESDDPFDIWLRAGLDEFLEPASTASVLFDTAPRRGPWRGLRPMTRRP